MSLIAVAMHALAPAAAQEQSPILLVSDDHGETHCDQPWQDVYSLKAGALTRLTNALDDTPNAASFCSIGYARPVLSPDGSMIAATRREGSSSTTVLMNLDGTNQRVVSDPREFHVTAASWAPEGDRLVHDGHDLPGLKIVELDGSEGTLVPNTRGFTDPAWSPDGSLIAFSFLPEQDGEGEPGTAPGGLGFAPGVSAAVGMIAQDNPRMRQAIGVIAPDGSGFRQVTLDPDIAAAARPAWSPDGRFIAFETQNPGCGGNRVSIVPAEGASEYETLSLPSDMCRAGGPAWLTDEQLAFWGATGIEEPDVYAGNRGPDLAVVRLTRTAGAESDVFALPGTTVVAGSTVLPPATALPDANAGEDGDALAAEGEDGGAGLPLALAILAAALGAAALLLRARMRDVIRRRPEDDVLDHPGCVARWDAARRSGEATRADVATALQQDMDAVAGAFDDLLVQIETARSTFAAIPGGSEQVTSEPDPQADTVARVLNEIAREVPR